MKKRWFAGLLAALLLLSAPLPAKAAGSVYFVAAEESVLPLTDASMPFWSGGYLYVAASVFTNLGVSVINNTVREMTVLEKERRALLFDWSGNYAQDSSGNRYTPGVIQSGGTVFVPASVAASFFGLQYSVTEVPNGSLVWLRSPDFGMSARAFANAATYNMDERYSAYIRDSQSGATEPAPVTPAAPTAGTRIHLCLEADSRTGSLLDALERAGGWAAFYCSPEFMEENGALLRRMAASGHGVGILLDGAAGDPEEQLRRADDALYRATLGTTRLVCLRNQEDGVQQALEQAGRCCLSPTLDRSGYKLESTSNASALLERVSSRRGDVSVWLGTTASAAGLREFVAAAQKAGHYCRALTEIG